MFKKFLVSLFSLKDIQDMLLKAKIQQKKLDEHYWKEKLQDIVERLNRERELDVQEFMAQITMLGDQIEDYKKREKELDKKEYNLKKQAKDNSFMATKIALKVEDFGLKILDIVGEMKGIRSEAEEHKLKIENK